MPIKWTCSSKHFVPAWNSRHRTACFSLYRRLLRLADLVLLPASILDAWSNSNPVRTVVRKAFRRNRADTSPRLVQPALKAGYRSLTVLSRAQNPESTEYARVLKFLLARLQERISTVEQKSLHPPHSKNPPRVPAVAHPLSVPLLVKVTPEPTPDNPNPKPVYTTPNRPRPLEEVPGKRHIPVLDMANDFPFLRFKKPQPDSLNRVLTQKIRTFSERQQAIKDMKDNGLDDADEEDDWDRLVSSLVLKEKGPARESLKARKARKFRAAMQTGEEDDWDRRWNKMLGTGLEEAEDDLRDEAESIQAGISYRAYLYKYGYRHILQLVDAERQDSIARADAMRKLIRQETELAVKEKTERDMERRRKWEARMLAEYGEGWEGIIVAEKRERDARRAKRRAAAEWKKKKELADKKKA